MCYSRKAENALRITRAYFGEGASELSGFSGRKVRGREKPNGGRKNERYFNEAVA